VIRTVVIFGVASNNHEAAGAELSWVSAGYYRLVPLPDSTASRVWDMGEPEEARVTAWPREGSPAGRAAVILTPDQRVRVFISSTLGELAQERAAARRAIRRLHLVPVWYESGARPHPPRSMYRAYLEQSQVFVGIYWQRYGWVAPGMEVSGLED
jgi:Domain of unknown function (DUF4062)